MGAALNQAGLHRLDRLGAVEGPDLRLLVRTQHDTFCGGAGYCPTVSVTFLTSCRSVESGNDSARHGWTTAYARGTVARDSFTREANSRQGQCITPSRSGGGVGFAGGIAT